MLLFFQGASIFALYSAGSITFRCSFVLHLPLYNPDKDSDDEDDDSSLDEETASQRGNSPTREQQTDSPVPDVQSVPAIREHNKTVSISEYDTEILVLKCVEMMRSIPHGIQFTVTEYTYFLAILLTDYFNSKNNSFDNVLLQKLVKDCNDKSLDDVLKNTRMTAKTRELLCDAIARLVKNETFSANLPRSSRISYSTSLTSFVHSDLDICEAVVQKEIETNDGNKNRTNIFSQNHINVIALISKIIQGFYTERSSTHTAHGLQMICNNRSDFIRGITIVLFSYLKEKASTPENVSDSHEQPKFNKKPFDSGLIKRITKTFTDLRLQCDTWDAVFKTFPKRKSFCSFAVEADIISIVATEMKSKDRHQDEKLDASLPSSPTSDSLSTTRNLAIEIIRHLQHVKLSGDLTTCAVLIGLEIETFTKLVTNILIECLKHVPSTSPVKETHVVKISVERMKEGIDPVKLRRIVLKHIRFCSTEIKKVNCLSHCRRPEYLPSSKLDMRRRRHLLLIHKYVKKYASFQKITDSWERIPQINMQATSVPSTGTDSAVSNPNQAQQRPKSLSDNSYTSFVFRKNYRPQPFSLSSSSLQTIPSESVASFDSVFTSSDPS